MKYLTEYVLYTACYTAAFNTDEIDLDDLDVVPKKHLACFALLLGLSHGKKLEIPLSPTMFDQSMMAHDPPDEHPPGDGPQDRRPG